MTGTARVGISGWRYPPWRGDFYPRGLLQRDELRYASEHLDSIEINGSFYSLQRPSSWERWREETPDDFVFSVKGPRFITHLLALRNAGTALANFFASGVLALGPKLGPVIWQLPERQQFDAERLDAFLASLPRTTSEAAALAAAHDERMEGRMFTAVDEDRRLRHALEVRSPSFDTHAAFDILRAHGVALVLADTAGRWPMLRERTAGFDYLRLHGADELYVSGYTPEALDRWAAEIGDSLADGRDVFVYFDNDTKVRAPYDAMALSQRIGARAL
ncbi:MAG: hypothetical protein JWN80_2775 [Microbacteriaceae bacterium]|jgi:uncharacterized protein YecE (DUF72 family)|nr:hypothetical protein [Microbacteriaceae bacterium]